jgi:hypothetical protein
MLIETSLRDKGDIYSPGFNFWPYYVLPPLPEMNAF